MNPGRFRNRKWGEIRVSLAGIVINNAIVLIDRIDIEREQNGLEPAQAVVEAAQRRLRPILLTTATTRTSCPSISALTARLPKTLPAAVS